MRMARRSSACGWPGGRLHADGPEEKQVTPLGDPTGRPHGETPRGDPHGGTPTAGPHGGTRQGDPTGRPDRETPRGDPTGGPHGGAPRGDPTGGSADGLLQVHRPGRSSR